MGKLTVLAYLILCYHIGIAQKQPLRIVFYNVENLFDTLNDPLTADDEFTPGGFRSWTAERYRDKLDHTARALYSAGDNTPPAFIGLAEVENKGVLDDLARLTVLSKGDYACVHYDSPDARGIDVALLYRRDRFRVLNSRPLQMEPDGDANFKTRDILYVSGLSGNDTLHLFVCHFPSMREGEEKTEWKRVAAASVLRAKTDSLLAANRESLIVIMGDLNGQATTEAQKALGTISPAGIHGRGALYNTGYHWLGKDAGSYRYRGKWQTLDHIIVSRALLSGRQGLKAKQDMGIFSAPFLLEKDTTYLGDKPLPTYRGPHYVGGYSDHLPVYLDLYR